jgi:hypothetical protein
MQIARTLWFTVGLASLAGIYLVFDYLPAEQGGKFILAEFGFFAIAFMATLLSGRPGRVHVTGLALGFLFATLISLGTSSSCSEGDLICLSPGEVFVVGLLIAGALYPGWALGVGVGNLVRGLSVGEYNH